MKKLILLLSVALISVSCSNSNEKKTILAVNGHCGMCKATIENSLKLAGIYEAEWSPKTKQLNVSYDSVLISIDTIAKHIAKVGYDTELIAGDDEAYEALDDCCKYERK